jgi:hypothetical protein
MRKILSTLLTGILVILGCSNKEAVTGISLDKSELSLVYGETATLTATVLPHNADNKTVSWSSSIPAIALVDNHGEVSATGAGSTVISAVTEDGGKSATCNLTVVEVENELRVMSFNIWGGGGKYVWMFNQHLNHCPYEPYMLNGIEYCGSGTLNTEEEAIASAWGARKNDVELTISEILKAQEEQIPIFLTDDFNEPSWLDWTERATTAGLCKIPVA